MSNLSLPAKLDSAARTFRLRHMKLKFLGRREASLTKHQHLVAVRVQGYMVVTCLFIILYGLATMTNYKIFRFDGINADKSRLKYR